MDHAMTGALVRGLHVDRPRRATKPSRAAKRKRLDTKRKTGHCAERLKESLRDVDSTDLAVRAVQVTGTQAVATVQTTQTGKTEPPQKLELAKEGSRWKLAGLA